MAAGPQVYWGEIQFIDGNSCTVGSYLSCSLGSNLPVGIQCHMDMIVLMMLDDGKAKSLLTMEVIGRIFDRQTVIMLIGIAYLKLMHFGLPIRLIQHCFVGIVTAKAQRLHIIALAGGVLLFVNVSVKNSLLICFQNDSIQFYGNK